MSLNLIPRSSSPFMCSLGIKTLTRLSRVHQTFTCPHSIHIFISPSSDSYTFTRHCHVWRTFTFLQDVHVFIHCSQVRQITRRLCLLDIHMFMCSPDIHVPTKFMCSPDVPLTLTHSPVIVMFDRHSHLPYIRCSQVSQMCNCSPDVHVGQKFISIRRSCSLDFHLFTRWSHVQLTLKLLADIHTFIRQFMHILARCYHDVQSKCIMWCCHSHVKQMFSC